MKDTNKHRVITMLNRREMEFLDKLGKDALFSTGHKLSYNDILKALTDLAMQLDLSAENADSADSLQRRMFEALWKKVEEQLKAKGGETKDETPNPQAQ